MYIKVFFFFFVIESNPLGQGTEVIPHSFPSAVCLYYGGNFAFRIGIIGSIFIYLFKI